MRKFWYSLPAEARDGIALLVLAAAMVAVVLLVTGCAAEGATIKQTGYVAGGGAVGAFFSPLGAAIGAGVAYLFGAASDDGGGGQIVMLGPLASIGHWIDGMIWWALAGYVALLLLVPASRDNLLAVFAKGSPFLDRIKAFIAGLFPRPHSPPAARARKAKREAKT